MSRDLLHELKRRKVFRVAVVYAATAFVVLQAADLILPALLLPEWTYRMLVLLTLFGFPVALALAWVLELTPGGVRVTTSSSTAAGEPPPPLLGRRTVVVTALLITLGAGLGAGLVLAPAQEPITHGSAAAAADAKSVAVLPFTDLSEAGDQKWFAEGIAEEILTSLARLPELRVIGRGSSFLFADGTLDDRLVADTLGVAHLLKGSVRRVGDRLRVTAQLVRAADGAQLWSESYDRGAADLLDVQRDVAENVAGALDVLLDEARRERMFASGTRNVEAFEAYMRGLEQFVAAHASRGTLEEANVWLGRALELDPRFARAAMLYADRYAHLVMFGAGGSTGSAGGLDDAQALEKLREALDLAVRNAPDEYHRVMAAINREFFAPSWHRMPALLEELRGLVHEAAPSPEDNWAPFVLVVTRQHDLALAHARRKVQVNPLEPRDWFHLAQVELAAGNVERARAVVDEGRRTAGAHRFLAHTENALTVVSGDRDAWLRRSLDPVGTAAALDGDTVQVLAAIRARVQSGDLPEVDALWAFHEYGARESSREALRRIDALPEGTALLAWVTYRWAGHIPFDITDAPNFSARLREAGVDPGAVPVLPRLGTAGAAR